MKTQDENQMQALQIIEEIKELIDEEVKRTRALFSAAQHIAELLHNGVIAIVRHEKPEAIVTAEEAITNLDKALDTYEQDDQS